MRFEDGMQTGARYRERFLSKITVPWCWQARARADLPPLVFWYEDEKLGRQYSCETKEFARTLQGKPEPAEDLMTSDSEKTAAPATPEPTQ